MSLSCVLHCAHEKLGAYDLSVSYGLGVEWISKTLEISQFIYNTKTSVFHG